MTSDKIRVDRETWERAQAWELDAWRRNGNTPLHAVLRRLAELLHLKRRNVGDDWNHWWAERFEGYRAIRRELDNAVELGCGPYTNMRIIMPGRKINQVVCSDPLAREYIKFRGRWLAGAVRRGLVDLDAHSIEECPFDNNHFDLTVMINVLDHVRDAQECLRQFLRIAKPGGYLVIGQDLTNPGQDSPDEEGAAGHPILLTHDFLDSELHAVEPILKKVLPREEGREPSAHYGTYLLIGRKRIT